MNPVAKYFRGRLHRRIFAWFGFTILMTGVVVALTIRFIDSGDSESWSKKAHGFLGSRFAHVWDKPADREELAAAIARDLDVDVTLEGADHRVISAYGDICRRAGVSSPVIQDGATVGTVRLCWERHRGRNFARAALPLGVALFMLWAASGVIARRLTRPIVELARVAADIGQGRLASRVRLRHGRHTPAEIQMLADVLNEMAARIERQLADQRALLAAVSHEIRTPLARIRLLVEMSRDAHGDDAAFDKLDGEVAEIDDLVSDLLASSRMDFAALVPVRLEAERVARDALARAQLDASKLIVDPAARGLAVHGDPTLVARALANVVANAKSHGGGLAALRVRTKPGLVVFEVEDDGEGFSAGEESRIFEPFYRRARAASGDGPSVGLGLTLVRRIAEAHGGSAYARNREGGGAVVVVELAARSEKA